MSGDREYCYPPTFDVLINKLGIRDAEALDRAERRLVTLRTSEPPPSGSFDLSHLKAIHHHLFQDVYDWAGKLRTVEIAKGSTQFQARRFIEMGMADVHRRLISKKFLAGLSAEDFAREAGEIIGDLNHVHPFREGNGRAQMIYLRELSSRAGHPINLILIDREAWMDASRSAHLGRYEPMAACILNSIAIS